MTWWMVAIIAVVAFETGSTVTHWYLRRRGQVQINMCPNCLQQSKAGTVWVGP